MASESPETPPASSTSAIDWTSAYRTHEDGLRKLVAYRMGDEAGAIDDVMQEVAIAVLGEEKKISRPEDPQKIGAWLRSITIHKVQDFWRKVQRRRRLRDRLEGEAPVGANEMPPSPYDWVLRVESIDAVREAMGKLETNSRVLLEQKYNEDITCKELAARHGVAIKTIEYRLKQARAELRRILRQSIAHSGN